MTKEELEHFWLTIEKSEILVQENTEKIVSVIDVISKVKSGMAYGKNHFSEITTGSFDGKNYFYVDGGEEGYYSFPAEYLTLSLQRVDELEREKLAKLHQLRAEYEANRLEEKKKLARQQDLKEYERLRAKLGLDK